MKVNLNDKTSKCIGCGLVDEKVECAGVYYCPNPFCSVSGSTHWKVKNLNVVETKGGLARWCMVDG